MYTYICLFIYIIICLLVYLFCFISFIFLFTYLSIYLYIFKLEIRRFVKLARLVSIMTIWYYTDVAVDMNDSSVWNASHYIYYSFEYFWMSQGFELKSRLAKIERCWPYFMGFGTPLTLVTMMSNNFIVNGCLFGMFFPFFIISSYLVSCSSFRWRRWIDICWPILLFETLPIPCLLLWRKWEFLNSWFFFNESIGEW